MAELNKRQAERYERAIASLNAILDEVADQKRNADKNVGFYLDGSGTLHLMVSPFSEDYREEHIVAEGRLTNAGGGDW